MHDTQVYVIGGSFLMQVRQATNWRKWDKSVKVLESCMFVSSVLTGVMLIIRQK